MRLSIRATDMTVTHSDASGVTVDIECADAESVREQVLRSPDDSADDWPLAKRYGEIVDECEKYRSELRRLQGTPEVEHLEGIDYPKEIKQLKADNANLKDIYNTAEEEVRHLEFRHKRLVELTAKTGNSLVLLLQDRIDAESERDYYKRIIKRFILLDGIQDHQVKDLIGQVRDSFNKCPFKSHKEDGNKEVSDERF